MKGLGSNKEREEYIERVKFLLTPDEPDQLFPRLTDQQRRMYNRVLKKWNKEKHKHDTIS